MCAWCTNHKCDNMVVVTLLTLTSFRRKLTENTARGHASTYEYVTVFTKFTDTATQEIRSCKPNRTTSLQHNKRQSIIHTRYAWLYAKCIHRNIDFGEHPGAADAVDCAVCWVCSPKKNMKTDHGQLQTSLEWYRGKRWVATSHCLQISPVLQRPFHCPVAEPHRDNVLVPLPNCMEVLVELTQGLWCSLLTPGLGWFISLACFSRHRSLWSHCVIHLRGTRSASQRVLLIYLLHLSTIAFSCRWQH